MVLLYLSAISKELFLSRLLFTAISDTIIMGAIGAVAEPIIVILMLLGGTWINRDFSLGGSIGTLRDERRVSGDLYTQYSDSPDLDIELRNASPSLLGTQQPKWRTRNLGVWGFQMEVVTPNTRRFRAYFLSRVLQRFPFLVECWYWALIYWVYISLGFTRYMNFYKTNNEQVYQLGRAATAVWMAEGTIVAAEKHALQVIAAEEYLHIFWEIPIQQFFIKNTFLITWINRIYSFIHIPGSIAFLIWLFYYTNSRNGFTKNLGGFIGHTTGPRLYERRRRTMALCNLLAFIIFTIWPCMPPRLLSADNSENDTGRLARSYGFIDTVHGPHGEGSIWTDNRFTNKFAAMPSLHFGYSFLIGLTIASLPLTSAYDPQSSSKAIILPSFNRICPFTALRPFVISIPSWKRMVCIIAGLLYPTIILVAIIATANHFILDAVAGSIVCIIAWWGNDMLLNLLVLEDWFLWVIRVHKPEDIGLEL